MAALLWPGQNRHLTLMGALLLASREMSPAGSTHPSMAPLSRWVWRSHSVNALPLTLCSSFKQQQQQTPTPNTHTRATWPMHNVFISYKAQKCPLGRRGDRVSVLKSSGPFPLCPRPLQQAGPSPGIPRDVSLLSAPTPSSSEVCGFRAVQTDKGDTAVGSSHST